MKAKHAVLAAILSTLALVACNKDPKEVLQGAAESMGKGDYADAEEKFRWLLERTPDDARLQANLAFSLTSQGKHKEAVEIYDKLIAVGDGSYDLFAYYAKSLNAVDRTDDAIKWNYRALTVVPELVDVRGDLAKILVKKNRSFEALTLLATFDDLLEEKGKSPYFHAQRIAIASALPSADEPGEREIFRNFKLDQHFHSIIVGNNGESIPFMIDTGATHTTTTREALQFIDVDIPRTSKTVTMQTANGDTVIGQEYVLPVFRVGPYTLNNVTIMTCEGCASLLGQTTLERFDLSTARVDGIEVLTMKPRPSSP